MIDREWKDFLKATESPCMDCSNRYGDICKFYHVQLDTMPGYGHIPCEKCNEDCEGDDE